MERDTSDLKFEMITTPEAKLKVLEFLRRYFFRDEPLVSSLKIAEDPHALKGLESFAMKSIDQNISVMALTPTEKVAGVALNSVKYKEESKYNTTSGTKFDKVAKLLEFLESQANTFEKFPGLDKFLFLDILSVDPSWRGVGLSKLLVNRVKDYAVSQGYKVVRIDCSSQYSAKAAMRIGFETVFSVSYEDYKEDGEQVFKIDAPHNEVNALLLRLNN